MLQETNLKLLRLAAVAGAVSLTAIAAARAAPTPVTVTLNPAAAGLSTQGAFQADSYTLSDFATVLQNNATHAFTESGVLQFESFKLGATTLLSSTTGLRNGTGSDSYGIYIKFSANGTINGSAPTQTGFFQNVTYTLVADPGNTDTVNPGGTALNDNGTPDVTIASGALGAAPVASDVNNVSLTFGTPSANVLLSLAKQGAGNAFFAAPPNLGFQEEAFVNTPSQATVTTVGDITTVVITAGGGNGSFAATATPEPASLAVLGVGLVGLGLVRRRKRG